MSQHCGGSVDRGLPPRSHTKGPVAHAFEPIIEVTNALEEDMNIPNSVCV